MSDVMERVNSAINNVLQLSLGLWAGIVLLALVVTELAQLRPQRAESNEWWPWDEEDQ